MNKIVFWLQGKIYPVLPNGELNPVIIKQTEFIPFASSLIKDDEEAKITLDRLISKISELIKEELKKN